MTPAVLSVTLSALGGTRTPNLLIRSQMLYPLSYERSHCSILHSRPSRCALETRVCNHPFEPGLPSIELKAPDSYTTGTLGVCEPRQEAAPRPAAADGLGAQGRPVEHRQADDAVARGAAIAKGRYRRRDSDPLR